MNNNTLAYTIPEILTYLNSKDTHSHLNMGGIIEGIISNQLDDIVNITVYPYHDMHLIPTYKIRCISNCLLFDITLRLYNHTFEYVNGFFKILNQEGNFYEYIN